MNASIVNLNVLGPVDSYASVNMALEMSLLFRCIVLRNALVIGLSDEVDESCSRTDRKPRVSRFEPAVFSIPPVAGSIKTSEFSKVLRHRGEVLQNESYRIHTSGLVWDAFRDQLQLLCYRLRQLWKVVTTRDLDSQFAEYSLATGLNQFLGRADRKRWVPFDGILEPLDLLLHPSRVEGIRRRASPRD